MNYEFKEIKKGERHLGAYTYLDLYTTHDGESFQLYKKAGVRIKEIREAQDRVPPSLFIKREDAINEVRMLQQQIDKELDELLIQKSPSAAQAHSLVEDALDVAGDGLKELSKSNDIDSENVLKVLDGVRDITKSIASKCFDNILFLENMLTVARKDFNTFQHSVQVAMYAMLFTMHEGFQLSDLQPLVFASMMHDIGIVFLPEKTVKSADKFSKHDYEHMQKHTKFGYDVLRHSFDDPRIARVCLEHHERLDGSGYPMGHNVSHEWSQLIGIIEIFDGMVGWRPHRVAPGPIEAIKTLGQMAENGKISKPLVNAFCASLVGKLVL